MGTGTVAGSGPVTEDITDEEATRSETAPAGLDVSAIPEETSGSTGMASPGRKHATGSSSATEGETKALQDLLNIPDESDPQDSVKGGLRRRSVAGRQAVGKVVTEVQRLCRAIALQPHLKVLGGNIQKKHRTGTRRRDGHSGYSLSKSLPNCQAYSNS